MLKKNFAILLLVLPLFLHGQSFNSGGQILSTNTYHVTYNFGELFTKSYISRNVQEGVLQTIFVVTSTDEATHFYCLKVYPVPFKNRFTIESDGSFDEFVVYNITGQLLLTGRLTEISQNIPLDDPGPFFILKIYSTTNGKFATFKIKRED